MIDERVEKYMPPVRAAIKRYVKNRDAFTDIYNRAYEAIMISMDEKDSALRAENERLRGALEGYAKEDNWLNFEGHDVWQRDEPGSELATKALKGGGDACTPMTKF